MPRSAAVPALPRLALLSLLFLFLSGCGKPAGLVEKSYFAGNNYWVAIINRPLLKDSGELPPIAREMCKDKEICLVGMWFDARQAPNLVPPTSQQQRDQIFIYGWRDATKTESMSWNCAVFPERDRTHECSPVSLNR